MNISFPEALLLLGLLLAVAAALSGWLHRTVLSISILSVVAGIALASLDVISVRPDTDIVVHIIELALVLTLFSDGLFVESELLRKHWKPPARALVIAMPITLLLLALCARALFPELGWAGAFLLAAVLTPTDPVVTSAVVTARSVPALVRHTLNLESGLNDGLALPFVLFFIVLAEPGGDAAGAGLDLLGEALVGAGMGFALASLAGRLLPRVSGAGIARSYEGVYALGLVFVAYGLAEVTYGNGLIAAFVAGIALAAAEHEAQEAFSHFNESVSSILQVGTFFLFGALVVTTGWNESVWLLVGFIAFALLVARPAAVLISFLGSRLPRREGLFMAWFGPKGVASMLFALFVLNSEVPERELLFDAASFVILFSIAVHGLTDTLGARWIGRRAGESRTAG